MTESRDALIRMAREAGLEWCQWRGGYFLRDRHQSATEVLQRFAELVRADERRKHQADIELWKAEAATAEKWRGLALAKDPMQPGKAVQEIQREAMAAMREACAKLCEQSDRYRGSYFAEKIRARGQA